MTPPDPNKTPPDPAKRQGARNPGASLQQRLRNHARATGEDVALVLTRYVNERFLYRLGRSPERDHFVLRGATLFAVWDAAPHRATRDIDLLVTGDSSPQSLRTVIARVCLQPTEEEDGVAFLPDTLRLEQRAEGRPAPGQHVEVTALLGTARLRLELDVAAGEAVVPPPAEVVLPSLLGQPPARLPAYRKETVLAEKCQALVSLGRANTRLKDFYDLWHLSRTSAFAGPLLCAALRATFTRRGTAYPADGLPPALTDAFSGDALKQQQWRAFLGKAAPRAGGADLGRVLAQLRAFLQPPLRSLARGEEFALHWHPQGGWSEEA